MAGQLDLVLTRTSAKEDTMRMNEYIELLLATPSDIEIQSRCPLTSVYLSACITVYMRVGKRRVRHIYHEG